MFRLSGWAAGAVRVSPFYGETWGGSRRLLWGGGGLGTSHFLVRFWRPVGGGLSLLSV